MKTGTRILFFAFCVFTFGVGYATTYTSTATSNWSTMTWSPAGTPGLTDDVVIADGHTVTIDQNVSIANLTVGGGASGVLTFDATTNREVKVSGNITVSAGGAFIVFPALTPTGDVTLGSNVVTNVSSTDGIVLFWNISGTGIATGSTISAFDATTITMSLVATLSGTTVPLSIKPTIKDSIYIGGNLINNGKFDMSLGSSTTVCNVIFNNTTGNQTISGIGDTTRFRGVTLAKGAIGNKVICSINVSMASTNITYTAGTWEQNAGRLTATSGSISLGTTVAGPFGFSVTGSGSAKIASNINSWGTVLVNTTDSVIIGAGPSKFDGSNNGGVSTFTSGTVVVYGKFNLASGANNTINGANIIIDPKGCVASDYAFRNTSGTSTYPFTFTSGTVTILNANGATGANAELAMSSGLAPNISGTAMFILGQGGSTLGSAQGYRISLNSVGALNHLTVNTGSVGVSILPNSNVTVKGTLTLTSGKLSIGGSNLTVGTISGGSSSAYVVMHKDSTGNLRRTFTAIGSTVFPIGDATSYSPCSIDVTSGTFVSAYIGARVANKKYINNPSTTDFLARYWTLTSSGVSNLNYDATFNYVDADVNGTESSIYGAQYRTSWTLLAPVNTGANTFSGTVMSTIGDFTGRSVESLNLTVLIEGFYSSGSNTMISDTVTVELRNSTTFALVDQAMVVLSSIGNATTNFLIAADATNYYLVVKHRNSMETWSNTPQSFTGGALTYDFTLAATQAYGDNMKQIDASPVRFGIYGGNIAPQDALIDLTDEIAVINDVNAFATGYLPTDLTGDDSADLSDIIIVVNNANAFISKQTPEVKSVVPVKVKQAVKKNVNID